MGENEEKKGEKTGRMRWPQEQMERIITILGHHDVLFSFVLAKEAIYKYIKENPALA